MTTEREMSLDEYIKSKLEVMPEHHRVQREYRELRQRVEKLEVDLAMKVGKMLEMQEYQQDARRYRIAQELGFILEYQKPLIETAMRNEDAAMTKE